jgi:hypothetical protein
MTTKDLKEKIKEIVRKIYMEEDLIGGAKDIEALLKAKEEELVKGLEDKKVSESCELDQTFNTGLNKAINLIKQTMAK